MKKRRDFIKTAGILSAGTMILPSFIKTPEMIHPIGIQLYTVRKEMLADARGTLKRLAALGITEIESAGSEKGYYYGLKPSEIKLVCNDLGITLRSGHVHIDKHWPETVAQAKESGQEYLICSSLPTHGQTIDNYKRVSERFNKAGEDCKRAGLIFGFHNHKEEFDSVDGQVLYDLMLDETDPSLVCMEMDLGWVVAASKDPFDYFKRYPNRFPLWHLKDMKGETSTEFGKGDLDIKRLLKLRKENGLRYFFIEQEEYSSSPFESMEINMKYLSRI